MRHPQRVYLFVCHWCQQEMYSPRSQRDQAEVEMRKNGWGLLTGEWHCAVCLPLLKRAAKRRPRKISA